MKTLNWMMCAAGLLVAGVNTEVRAAAPEAMTRMVRMLAETDDAQLQLDILRGLSAGFRGQERLPMPAGWEQVESRLGEGSCFRLHLKAPEADELGEATGDGPPPQ